MFMDTKKQVRRIWAENRALMEANPVRETVTRKRSWKKFSLFDALAKGFELALQFTYKVFEAWGTHWAFFVFTTDGISPSATIKIKTMTELARIKLS